MAQRSDEGFSGVGGWSWEFVLCSECDGKFSFLSLLDRGWMSAGANALKIRDRTVLR